MLTSTRKNSALRLSSALLGVSLLLGAAIPSAPASAEAPVLSAPGYAPAALNAPLAKPLWTAPIDKPGPQGFLYATNAVAEKGNVYSVMGGKLLARSAESGKEKFRYGTGLRPFVVYEGSSVYVVQRDGKIAALNAATGKLKWTSSAGGQEEGRTPIVRGDTVYATTGNVVTAFRASDGKKLWKQTEKSASYAPYEIQEHDGVVLMSYVVSGAITSIQLDAVDKGTGKLLWKADSTSSLLDVKDGKVYAVKDGLPNADLDATPNRVFKVSVLDLRTGKSQGIREYGYKLPGQPPYPYGGERAFLDGSDLYLDTGANVLKFDFSRYVPGQKPSKTYAKRSERTELAGKPASGRLFLVDRDSGALRGLKTANGDPVSWAGDNPAVRTEVFGNGVYSAQSDGFLYAFNLQTTDPVLKVNAGSRLFGPTLRTGSILIVQTDGKLIAVRIPGALN
ncbi:outer membrane protein assembly factor BamB family protein [Paenibacillus humicus]|uniref:outer membrane protein assembly factor BamB family protein n=1 Tax=Paenibacillus humicus TaxID=412861 RepID=UPI0013E2A5AA|nr:PQQ-binding-like beta-propeller repeat protein [Paenibacillus humicus]